jgi:hypothetical protein
MKLKQGGNMINLNAIIKLVSIASLFFLLALCLFSLTLSCKHGGKAIDMTIMITPPNELPLYNPPTEYEI